MVKEEASTINTQFLGKRLVLLDLDFISFNRMQRGITVDQFTKKISVNYRDRLFLCFTYPVLS